MAKAHPVVATVVSLLAVTQGCAVHSPMKARAQAPTGAIDRSWKLVRTVRVAPAMSSENVLYVSDVGFDSDRHGIAVCSGARILVTFDGGTRWDIADLPLTNGSLVSLEILDESTAWVAGGNVLRASSDGGRRWRELPYRGGRLSEGNYLSFIDAETGWYAIGRSNGTAEPLAMTRDGGQTWSPVNVPEGAEENIMAIDLVSEETGFVLMASGSLIRTQDAGKSWSTVEIPQRGRRHVSENIGMPIEAVRFTDPLHGVVVLYFERPRGFVVFETEDGGESWQERELPGASRVPIGNVYLSRDAHFLTVKDVDSEEVLLYRHE